MRSQKLSSLGLLRRRAEKQLRQKEDELTRRSQDEVRAVIHELHVHQIELQLQNEDLRLAQQELEAGRERYVQLFDFAPVGYLTLARNGLILRANITSEGMLGAKRSQLHTAPFRRFVFGPDQRKYYSWWAKVFLSRDSRSCELRLQPATGQIIHVHLQGVRANEDGRIVCQLTISDITEQRLAEAQARKAEVAVEAQRAREDLAHLGRVTLLGELAGSLAHELNQPLAAILSNAEAAELLMNGHRRSDEEVCEVLRDIAQQAQRAGQLIAEMRGMLKKGREEKVAQDMNAAVTDVMEMMRAELRKRRVTPVLRLDPLLPLVRGSGVQLRQVLLNLAMNACDAMTDRPADGRELMIESRRAGEDEVAILVADSGSGFSEEMLRRPFEPFHTTKPEGLGLGLAICRSIAVMHGGRLEAANNGHKGATLRLTLPALSGSCV